MNKQQAISALKIKTDGVISAQQSVDGTKKIEILQFSQYAINQDVLDRYWLVFVNDKLMEWTKPPAGQKPADIIIDMNINKTQ